MRRAAEDKNLDKAALLAATGISPRYLTRLLQLGLVPTIEPRHGLGRGRGTTPFEYPLIAVATINRHEELRQEFKRVDDRRWRLWLEGYPVRIAPDLAETLAPFGAVRSKIKSLDDIEKLAAENFWKPGNIPRGDPLRVIFRDLSNEESRSLMTMVICFLFGVKLPIFDEPNPLPFRVLKRVLGLPKEWQMPPDLFDTAPHPIEQIRNALSTATPDELNGARTAGRLLSRLLDNPHNSRRGAIVVAGTALPWRPIKLASLMWPSQAVRATTVGLVIRGIRMFKATFGENAASAFASVASGSRIFFPEFPV